MDQLRGGNGKLEPPVFKHIKIIHSIITFNFHLFRLVGPLLEEPKVRGYSHCKSTAKHHIIGKVQSPNRTLRFPAVPRRGSPKSEKQRRRKKSRKQELCVIANFRSQFLQYPFMLMSSHLRVYSGSLPVQDLLLSRWLRDLNVDAPEQQTKSGCITTVSTTDWIKRWRK